MKRKVISVVAVIATFLLPPSSQAIEIFLTGPTEADVGTQFEIGFWLDLAGEELIGGGVDLFYDPTRVDFSDFVFNASFDSGFSLFPADDGFGTLSLLTFGSLFPTSSANPLLVGTFTFDAVGPGLADFSLNPDTIAGWATLADAFFNPASIGLSGWSVNIIGAPEPSVLLLLAGGVLLMTGVRRKAISR